MVLAVMAAFHSNTHSSVALKLICVGLMVLGASSTLTFARRIGERGLLAQALARVGVTVALAGAAPSAATTFVACGGFLWVSIWIVAFFSRRIMVAALLTQAMAVVLAAAINQHHLRTLVAASTILIAATLISLVLSEVIGGLHRQARHDHLTGLLNRYGIDQALANLAWRQRSTGPISLVAIDLDGFKIVNDRQGHLAGDGMLIAFAGELENAARSGCFVARVGGDEFIAVLPGLSEFEAITWAASVRGQSSVAWSFGVAERSPSEELEAWIARADRLMYEAKVARRAAPRAAAVASCGDGVLSA